MGNGRARAKQTKVARDLKYNTPVVQVDKLNEEFSTSSHTLSAKDTDLLNTLPLKLQPIATTNFLVDVTEMIDEQDYDSLIEYMYFWFSENPEHKSSLPQLFETVNRLHMAL